MEQLNIRNKCYRVDGAYRHSVLPRSPPTRRSRGHSGRSHACSLGVLLVCSVRAGGIYGWLWRREREFFGPLGHHRVVSVSADSRMTSQLLPTTFISNGSSQRGPHRWCFPNNHDKNVQTATNAALVKPARSGS